MEILCLKKVVNQLICGIQEKFIKGSGPVLRPPEGGGRHPWIVFCAWEDKSG